MQAGSPVCAFITVMVPAVKCLIQARASQRESWEVLELPPPEGALGLSQLSPADPRGPSEHTRLSWWKDLTSLHYENVQIIFL